jgi:hypothetical protein
VSNRADKGAGTPAPPLGLHRDGRDERLWSLLPSKSAPYDVRILSKAETDALVEALSDGFGGVLYRGHKAMPLPDGVKSGLLEHSFHVSSNSEYDPNEWNGEFWESPNDEGEPPPAEWFPLRFIERRLRVYFQNQFDRFCERVRREDPWWSESVDPAEDRWLFEERAAASRLYEKPWYEFHALQLLDWVGDRNLLKHPNLARMCSIGFAGQLGRLVEQYYWRFRFEGAAITGAGARKGASAGGKAKAELHRPLHSRWQKAASEIWTRRPELSKIAVAQRVRKNLRDPHTARHIARYISHH